jgi:hypothetical protein
MNAKNSVQALDADRRRLKALEGTRRIMLALEAANDSLQTVDDPFGSTFLQARIMDVHRQLSQAYQMVDGLALMMRKSTVAILASFLVLTATVVGADCYYGCSEDNPPDDGVQYNQPGDAVQYNLGRDGEYHPVGNAGPPATVYGPPVYFRNGYPIPVPTEPPAYRNHHYDNRRELRRQEFNNWHDQNHRDFVNGKRF